MEKLSKPMIIKIPLYEFGKDFKSKCKDQKDYDRWVEHYRSINGFYKKLK